VIPNRYRFIRPDRDFRELLILSEIAANPRVSQRALGRSANITAAMVNHYILELVAHEYVHVEGTTNRTMSYHLTPAGAGRKAALQEMVFTELSGVFAQIKSIYQGALRSWSLKGCRRALVLGSGEKAELAALAAREAGLEVNGLVNAPADWQGEKPDLFIDCRAEAAPWDHDGIPVERL
jgi:predicted transcriptional regulator